MEKWPKNKRRLVDAMATAAVAAAAFLKKFSAEIQLVYFPEKNQHG